MRLVNKMTNQMTVTEFARMGGSVKSDAKKAAAKINGLLGGRPLKIQLNDDGLSVKGCNMIYAPKGQALEYAALAANPYRGCGHACAYCYVPQILRMDRREFNNGAVERTGFLKNLETDARKYGHLTKSDQVMLSFTSDPYHPDNTTLTRDVIKTLHNNGISVSILTKGGTRSLRDIDLFDSSMDCFGSTLTSLDDDFSKKWEPNAALPMDRLKALKEFHDAGIFTWASLEPTIDCESSLKIVEKTHQFVDLFKIGRVNYLPITKTTDWKDYTLRMIDLCQRLGVKHYIKQDLQCYLPDGYYNPLRINQHH
jgi:DNA repair photolyase